jgi:hypothetical protein
MLVGQVDVNFAVGAADAGEDLALRSVEKCPSLGQRERGLQRLVVGRRAGHLVVDAHQPVPEPFRSHPPGFTPSEYLDVGVGDPVLRVKQAAGFRFAVILAIGLLDRDLDELVGDALLLVVRVLLLGRIIIGGVALDQPIKFGVGKLLVIAAHVILSIWQ